MSGYISNGVVIFLHWLCFVIIDCYCHLDFKTYAVVERRLPLRSNAVSRSISKINITCAQPPVSQICSEMGSSLAYVAPCHQVSWELGWQILCNPAYRQTALKTMPPWVEVIKAVSRTC